MNEAFTFQTPDDREIRKLIAEAKQQRWVAAGEVTGKALKATGRALRSLVEALAEGHRMYRLYNELSAMSDRQLDDMGITRGDIPAVVAGTYRRHDEPTPFVAIPPKPATPVAADAESRKAA